MATLREIKKRIVSVKNTEQITKAMKMIAASRLRKSQENVLKARPYSHNLEMAIADLAMRSKRRGHPLLRMAEGNERKIRFIVLTSDRGLCGAFNSSIIRTAEKFLELADSGMIKIDELPIPLESDDNSEFAVENLELVTIGRKARDYFKRRREIKQSFTGISHIPTYREVKDIADEVADEFMSGEIDQVWLLYNEFKSVMSQNIVLKKFLPLTPAKLEEGATPVDFLYEPDKEAVLDDILRRYVSVWLYQAVLESTSSEQAARMTAMEAASKNAGEMIDHLTLKYNRARQATITTALIEVVSGAEAL